MPCVVRRGGEVEGVAEYEAFYLGVLRTTIHLGNAPDRPTFGAPQNRGRTLEEVDAEPHRAHPRIWETSICSRKRRDSPGERWITRPSASSFWYPPTRQVAGSSPTT